MGACEAPSGSEESGAGVCVRRATPPEVSGRRHRPSPVVVLEAAGIALVAGGAGQAEQEAERVFRHPVHAVAFQLAADACRAAANAVRVAGEDELDERVGVGVVTTIAALALSAGERVGVDELLERVAVGARLRFSREGGSFFCAPSSAARACEPDVVEWRARS